MSLHFHSSYSRVSDRKPVDIPSHPGGVRRSQTTWSALIPPSGVAARKNRRTIQGAHTYDAPSDWTGFHGAPPLRATLAREVNGKMMGRLLFGNVGRGRRVSQGTIARSGFLLPLSLLLWLPGIS